MIDWNKRKIEIKEIISECCNCIVCKVDKAYKIITQEQYMIEKLEAELSEAYVDIENLDRGLHKHSKRHFEMYEHIFFTKDNKISKLEAENALMLEALKKCHKHYINLNNMFNGNCIHDSDYLENIINQVSGDTQEFEEQREDVKDYDLPCGY